MIVDILILVPFVLVFLAYRATTPSVAPTTGTPAPAAANTKDRRPLWAEVPLPDYVGPRCTAWENEEARLASRLEREAQAGKGRPLPRFVPTPELPPQRKFHKPLKGKGRNWA